MNIDTIYGLKAVSDIISFNTTQFPLTEFTLKLLPFRAAEAGYTLRDSSWVLQFDGKPIVAVTASRSDGRLGLFNGASLIEVNSELENDRALKIAGKHVRNRLAENAFSIRTSQTTDLVFLQELLHLEVHHELCFEATIDLSKSEEELWSGIRSEHKRNIRKATDLLDDLVVFWRNDPGGVFEAFRELHRVEAGRITRPLQSWVEMRNAIIDGSAYLVAARKSGEYIGFSFFWLSTHICSYGSAAYRRDLFSEIPIAHSLVWRGLLWGKSKGARQAMLGEAFRNSMSSKERSISLFKRGFGTAVHAFHYLTAEKPGTRPH